MRTETSGFKRVTWRIAKSIAYTEIEGKTKENIYTQFC